MKRVIIPEGLKGKDLARFVSQNKDALIAQKKSIPVKYADAVSFGVNLYNIKDGIATKSEGSASVSNDTGTVRVKVVANTANWCDSHMDVLLPGCWDKSIKERKGFIPHLHDHVHTLEAEVGDVVDIYSQTISLTELGLSKSGTTEVLVFETDIRKDYNEKVYYKYLKGKVKQHSIGLQYIKLGLAINDDEDTAHYELWNKYIDQVINREMVEQHGYFWVVPEIKLLENSAVLFGSNELTPTLGVKSDTLDEPVDTTQTEPLKSEFNIREAIEKTNFINL